MSYKDVYIEGLCESCTLLKNLRGFDPEVECKFNCAWLRVFDPDFNDTLESEE